MHQAGRIAVGGRIMCRISTTGPIQTHSNFIRQTTTAPHTTFFHVASNFKEFCQRTVFALILMELALTVTKPHF